MTQKPQPAPRTYMRRSPTSSDPGKCVRTVRGECSMFLVREVLNCRPGKVAEMVKRFETISRVMERMDLKPFRLLTDVSGERFWTLVAETEVPSLNAFVELEAR